MNATSPALAILTIGSEILDGRIVDTNSAFLGRSARAHGLAVSTRVACDDDMSVIVGWIDRLLYSADVLVITGGLGPTPDDLTRDALAAFSGRKLDRVEKEFEKLTRWYESKGRVLTELNARQSLFPEGATIIHNPVGTAAGIWLEVNHQQKAKVVVALPGIPLELQPMWREDVLPKIGRFCGVSEPSTSERVFRTFGLAESEVARRVVAIPHESEVQIAYQVSFPETIVVARGPLHKMETVANAIRTAIGTTYIVSERYDTPLARSVFEALKARHQTISVAESCTGGMLGELLTRYPGSSSVFLGGFVTYSNELKRDLLGVPEVTLNQQGAVSGAVVRAMASGALARTHSSMAVSISGIAGPEGGTPTKPVGTFFIGLATGNGTKSYKFFFSSDRDRVRTFAAYKALELIRRELTGLAAPEDGEEE